jgi:hypothetical protein
MADVPDGSSRRDFLKRSVLLALAARGNRLPGPAQAPAVGHPYRTLDAGEVRTLESLGEVLVPGSATAGIAQFIDVQLSGSSADSLLMIKYLGLNPPFTDFYRSGLAALNVAASRRFGRGFSALASADAHNLVGAMAKGEIPEWQGPPGPLYFFVLRNDAVDVVYGTVMGYESLGVPYMPHIEPPTRWGE